MRQGLTRCDRCRTMRSASYSSALEKWLCAECAVRILDDKLLPEIRRAREERKRAAEHEKLQLIFDDLDRVHFEPAIPSERKRILATREGENISIETGS